MMTTLDTAKDALIELLKDKKSRFLLVLLEQTDANEHLQVCGDMDPYETQSVLADILEHLSSQIGKMATKEGE